MKPIIALAMGYPSGIGPETAVKLAGIQSLHDRCRPLVIGDLAVLERAASFAGGPQRLRPVLCPSEAEFRPGTLEVIDLANVDLSKLRLGSRTGDGRPGKRRMRAKGRRACPDRRGRWPPCRSAQQSLDARGGLAL